MIDFYIASSQKQYATGRYMIPLQLIILIPSQAIFASLYKFILLNQEC